MYKKDWFTRKSGTSLPVYRHEKRESVGFPFHLSAEREGFEPPVPLGTVVFKTTVIDHSTISPSDSFLEIDCKGTIIICKTTNEIGKNALC